MKLKIKLSTKLGIKMRIELKMKMKNKNKKKNNFNEFKAVQSHYENNREATEARHLRRASVTLLDVSHLAVEN